ncbi:MAG: hypothetical protein NT027_04730 [Proteobacteria bacterium]|nr:hypothetical protein [Pseudomonadota bacterium]
MKKIFVLLASIGLTLSNAAYSEQRNLFTGESTKIGNVNVTCNASGPDSNQYKYASKSCSGGFIKLACDTYTPNTYCNDNGLKVVPSGHCVGEGNRQVNCEISCSDNSRCSLTADLGKEVYCTCPWRAEPGQEGLAWCRQY